MSRRTPSSRRPALPVCLTPAITRARSEPLEARRLFSISVAVLAGPIDVVGTHWEYAAVDGSGNTVAYIETAAGPTTFNGNACLQIDVGPTAASHTYQSFDGAGNYQEFGGVIHYPSGANQTDTFTPVPTIPAQLDAGVTYTSSYTDNGVTVDSTGTTTDTESDTDTTMLVSDTTSPITVPAGTYDAYEVRTTDTAVTPNGDGTSNTDVTTTDEWVVPGIGMVKSTEYGQDGSVEATFSLTVFKSVNSKLAFIQQPLNAAVGDTVQPAVTVQLQDAEGHPQTAGTGSVTLNLVAGSTTGTGKLSGTLTEPIIGGIATFSDLSIDAGGKYQLAASDVSSSPATPATSELFNVTDAKLVFVNGPHNGNVGEALDPAVTVELEDAHNNPITTSDGTVVTLNPVGVSDGATVTGNTATLVGGVATFKALTFPKPGQYQLDATDPAGDAEATAPKFTIGGDKLAFKALPKTFAAGAVVKPAIVVNVVDPKGKVDTTNNDSIQITFHDNSGSIGDVAFVAAAVNGKVSFGNVQIPKSGTFSVTALDGTTNAATGDPDAVTRATGTVVVTGTHLSFKALPKAADVGATFKPAVVVTVLDSKGKVVTTNTDSIQITFHDASGTVGDVVFVKAAVGGKATFADVALQKAGTYTVTALDGTTNAATGDPDAVVRATGSVTVVGTHLAFKALPKTADAGVAFKPAVVVAVEDSKGKVVTSVTDTIQISFTADAGDNAGAGFFANAVNGKVTFPNVVLQKAGTYTVTALDGTTNAATGDPDAVTRATGSVEVTGTHLEFKSLPKSADAGTPFKPAVAVAVVDSKGKVVTTNTDTLQVSFTDDSGTSVGAGYFGNAVNGKVTFDSVVLQKAGTYTATALDGTANAATGDPDAVTRATGSVEVTGTHLEFASLPKSADAGTPFKPAVVVAVVNSKGKVVTTNNDTLQVSFTDNSGTSVGAGYFGNAVNGRVTFDNVVLPKGGTYTATALDGTTNAATGDPDAVTRATAEVDVLGLHLALQRLPTSVTVGATVSPPIVVLIEDSKNRVVTGNNDSLQITFRNNAGGDGGHDFGAIAVNGRATFSNVAISAAGTFTVTALDPTAIAATNDSDAVTSAFGTVTVTP